MNGLSPGRRALLAVICDFLDAYLVDRLVSGVAKIPRLFGRDGAGPVSERVDPVLRGGLGALRGVCSVLLFLILILSHPELLAVSPTRIDGWRHCW